MSSIIKRIPSYVRLIKTFDATSFSFQDVDLSLSKISPLIALMAPQLKEFRCVTWSPAVPRELEQMNSLTSLSIRRLLPRFKDTVMLPTTLTKLVLDTGSEETTSFISTLIGPAEKRLNAFESLEELELHCPVDELGKMGVVANVERLRLFPLTPIGEAEANCVWNNFPSLQELYVLPSISFDWKLGIDFSHLMEASCAGKLRVVSITGLPNAQNCSGLSNCTELRDLLFTVPKTLRNEDLPPTRLLTPLLHLRKLRTLSISLGSCEETRQSLQKWGDDMPQLKKFKLVHSRGELLGVFQSKMCANLEILSFLSCDFSQHSDSGKVIGEICGNALHYLSWKDVRCGPHHSSLKFLSDVVGWCPKLRALNVSRLCEGDQQEFVHLLETLNVNCPELSALSLFCPHLRSSWLTSCPSSLFDRLHSISLRTVLSRDFYEKERDELIDFCSQYPQVQWALSMHSQFHSQKTKFSNYDRSLPPFQLINA